MPSIMRHALTLLLLQPAAHSAADDSGSRYPLTLDNCGREITVEAPPISCATARTRRRCRRGDPAAAVR